MSAIGKVRGLGLHYRDGTERMEIWISKKEAADLPHEEGLRIPISLIIGCKTYMAGIRTTARASVVTICPNLEDEIGEKVRLIDVLADAKIYKNQAVELVVEGNIVRLQ